MFWKFIHLKSNDITIQILLQSWQSKEERNNRISLSHRMHSDVGHRTAKECANQSAFHRISVAEILSHIGGSAWFTRSHHTGQEIHIQVCLIINFHTCQLHNCVHLMIVIVDLFRQRCIAHNRKWDKRILHRSRLGWTASTLRVFNRNTIVAHCWCAGITSTDARGIIPSHAIAAATTKPIGSTEMRQGNIQVNSFIRPINCIRRFRYFIFIFFWLMQNAGAIGWSIRHSICGQKSGTKL